MHHSKRRARFAYSITCLAALSVPKFRERCKLFYMAQIEKCRCFPSISVKDDQSAVFWRKGHDPAYRHPKS